MENLNLHNFDETPARYPLVIQAVNNETHALYLCDQCLNQDFLFTFLGKTGPSVFIRCARCLKIHCLKWKDYQWRAGPPKTPAKEA
jgi:hypothetical protein